MVGICLCIQTTDPLHAQKGFFLIVVSFFSVLLLLRRLLIACLSVCLPVRLLLLSPSPLQI